MTANNNNNNMYESDLSIFDAANIRWLNVEEIIALLSSAQFDQQRYGQGQQCILDQESAPPSSPPTSGTVLLYDRIAVRNYKADGHEWIRKRSNPSKVREDHVKLRFEGKYRVGGTYVHSAETATLHRRVYRLIKSAEEKAAASGKQEFVLVHYLDTDEATKTPTKTSSSSSSTCSTKRTRSSSRRNTSKNETAITGYSVPTTKRIRTANSYAKVLENPPTKACNPAYLNTQPISWTPLGKAVPVESNTSCPKSLCHEESLDGVNFDVLWDLINSDAALGDSLDELIDPQAQSAGEQVQSTLSSEVQQAQQQQRQPQPDPQVEPQPSYYEPPSQQGYSQPAQPPSSCFSTDDIVPVEV